MKTRNLLTKRLGGLFAGLVFSAGLVVTGSAAPVSAAAPVVTELYTHTSDNMQGLYVSTGPNTNSELSYPFSAAQSNWPLRSNGCGTSSPMYKAMPWLPGGTNSPPVNQSGNVIGLSGNCMTGAMRLWRDGGTDIIAPWSNLSGAWLSPDLYGGWADPDTSPAMSTARAMPVTSCTYPMSAGKVVNAMAGSPAVPIPMEPGVENVWARACTDRTNFFRPLFERVFTPAQVDGQVSLSGNNNDEFLHSYGTSLLRSSFTITADELERIKFAEEKNTDPANPDHGLFIDIVADDWYAAYMNKVPVAGSNVTVDRRKEFVPWQDLRIGQNVLAVQATDKLMKYRTDIIYGLLGAGVAYQLVLYDDPNASLEAEFRPTVTLTPASGAQIGGTYQANFNVTNVGRVSGDVRYTTRIFNDANDNGQLDPGEVVQSAGPTLRTNVSGAPAGNNSFQPASMSGTITSTDFGSGRICAEIVLTPVSGRGSVNPASEVVCIVLNKVPKLHIKNGDITVGGGILSSSNCEFDPADAIIEGVADNYGESKAQYGVIAMGKSLRFGSSNSAGSTNPTNVGSRLTFANTPSTPSLGYFRGTTNPVQNCLNNPYDYFQDKVQLGTTGLPAGITYSAANGGTYTVGAVPIGTGERRIYDAGNRDVRFVSDIQYPNMVGSIDDLSQFVMMTTGTIYVRENVERIDGVLVAGDGFYTCRDLVTTPQVGLTRCDEQLTINGAVFVGNGSLMPWRTFGADDANQLEPAELFNLSPAVIIPERGAATETDIRTIRLEELPPRF